MNWEFKEVKIPFIWGDGVATYSNDKRYLRVSLDMGGKEYAEYARIYWFNMVWGLPNAQFKILKRIDNEIKAA